MKFSGAATAAVGTFALTQNGLGAAANLFTEVQTFSMPETILDGEMI